MTPAAVDRAAAVRAALRALVAERGFHGASMGAVAREAGVATGTAYVHYASKDDLVLATYLETKAQLAEAATADVDPDAPPADRFRALWLGVHGHLRRHPDHARFLVQVDVSPYRAAGHAAAVAQDDRLVSAATAADITALLLPLPLDVLWELGLGPAVRLAAEGVDLDELQLRAVADACWRAVTTAP